MLKRRGEGGTYSIIHKRVLKEAVAVAVSGEETKSKAMWKVAGKYFIIFVASKMRSLSMSSAVVRSLKALGSKTPLFFLSAFLEKIVSSSRKSSTKPVKAPPIVFSFFFFNPKPGMLPLPCAMLLTVEPLLEVKWLSFIGLPCEVAVVVVGEGEVIAVVVSDKNRLSRGCEE